jgi:hypothetical protein
LESKKIRGHLEELDVDGRTILIMDLKVIECDSGDWIHLDQERDHWRAFLNPVLNLQLP